MLCATTANDGHFGPLLPFARACAAAGHEVRVAAPASYAAAVARAGFAHEPFADAPPDLVGPVMASLPSLGFVEADELVVREVFARIDAQAGLPSVIETVERWRPDVLLRESAELASLAAAERAGVPHVHVCIGMHEVATRFAEAIGEPLEELGRLAGLGDGRLPAALADETVFSAVPDVLDHAAGDVPPEADAFLRFHEPPRRPTATTCRTGGTRTRRSCTSPSARSPARCPTFTGVYREAVDVLADVEARVLITVGRKLEPAALGPLPANAHATQWWPQAAVLAHAAAMLGHGGFGTTMGALAAGVPQVVAPLFTFDQIVNGEHVAAVGAGHRHREGPPSRRAAEQVPRLLEDRDVRRVRSPHRGGDARPAAARGGRARAVRPGRLNRTRLRPVPGS